MAGEINWKEAYDDFLPRIFHFFCYRVGDRNIAEELTSITFEKAWGSRERYRSDIAAFQFWLFGIAQKVAADHFRRHRLEIPLEALKLSSSQDVERDIETKMDFEKLSTLLKSLPEREQTLVAMKYGAELNNREISKLTGLSESNVGTILSRTVIRLRAEWERENG